MIMSMLGNNGNNERCVDLSVKYAYKDNVSSPFVLTFYKPSKRLTQMMSHPEHNRYITFRNTLQTSGEKEE